MTVDSASSANKTETMTWVGDCQTGHLQLIDQTLLPNCLLYTSPSPRDRQKSRMPSSA